MFGIVLICPVIVFMSQLSFVCLILFKLIMLNDLSLSITCVSMIRFVQLTPWLIIRFNMSFCCAIIIPLARVKDGWEIRPWPKALLLQNQKVFIMSYHMFLSLSSLPSPLPTPSLPSPLSLVLYHQVVTTTTCPNVIMLYMHCYVVLVVRTRPSCIF